MSPKLNTPHRPPAQTLGPGTLSDDPHGSRGHTTSNREDLISKILPTYPPCPTKNASTCLPRRIPFSYRSTANSPPHAPSTPRGPPLSPRKSHRTHNYSCNLPQAKAPRADQLAIPTVAEQLLHALPCCCKCRPSSPRSHSRRPKQQQTQLHQQPNSRRAGAKFYRPENQPQRCSNCCPTKTESGTSG